MQFIKNGRTLSVLSGLPPLEDAADQTQTAQRARWDIVQGILLWELWTRLSLNDMRRRYKRTLLGPAWMTISMLVFALTMSVVWAGLWNQKVAEFLPFLLAGLIPWTMLSGMIGEGTSTFLAGEGLIKNQQFPYSVLIYGMVVRNIILFFHNIVGYLIVAVICGVQASWSLLLIVPGMLLVIINCAWMALLVAIFCLRFRDFQQIVTSLLQIATFVTPIFWNASQIQGKRAIIVHGNVLYHMVELLRRPLLGEYPSSASFLACIASAIIGWWLTFRLYSSKRHRLPYWF